MMICTSQSTQYNFSVGQALQNDMMEKAQKQLNRSQEIGNHMYIPSENIKINQKTKSHSHFEKYDHSLESNRLASLREKYNYQEPESSVIDVSNVEMSTKPYENIDPSEIPNLNGIFDNTFEI